MLISLSEVLAIPEVAEGNPVVANGDPDGCLVRWVHSSEVFEMGPLLRGGELLLTTGLGLRGLPAMAHERYVDALADAGLAALAFELGRTFSVLPDRLLAAARRRNLVVVTFTEVVPFEVIIEAFHNLVMDREVAGLRRGDRIWNELIDVVTQCRGLPAVVEKAGRLAGGTAYLVGSDGHLVAGPAGVNEAPAATSANSQPVHLHGTTWGTLVIPEARASALRDAVLVRAARAVSVELSRGGRPEDGLAMASGLLRDIVEGRVASSEDLRAQCEAAGFPALPGRPLVALVLVADRRASLRAISTAALRAGRESFGICLGGYVDGELVLITRMPRDGELKFRAGLEAYGANLATGLGDSATCPSVIAGRAVADVDQLADSIREAVEGAAIARRLSLRGTVVLAKDLGVYRLLAKLGHDPELAEFLREQLGPLLDYDASRGSDLVHTLDCYLQSGMAKSATAVSLGVRRQTLYDRLARIEEVLGPEALSDHGKRTALTLALHAWHLRTGA